MNHPISDQSPDGLLKPQRSGYSGQTGLVLFLLIVFAAGLRFTALDRPVIWGDEAATAGRVIGSYQELVDQLADGSFTPLHYQTLWWMAQGFPLWAEVSIDPSTQKRTLLPTTRLIPDGILMTPFFLRLVPAVSGVLMIPAIYFLSRQMFGPRVSLTAAGLTCVSAYLLIYSRDAKMYMPFWLLCTLNVGCVLWWIRVRTWTAWLCWVITGVMMLGYHALGSFILLVNGLIVLTAPRQYWSGWWKLIAILSYPVVILVAGIYEVVRRRFELHEWWRFANLLGYPSRIGSGFHFPTILLAGIGLYCMVFPIQEYFDSFNRRTERVLREDGTFDTDANGTGWVERYNRGRTLGSLMLYTTSAYLTGWEWPKNQARDGIDEESRILPRTLKLLQFSVVVLLVGLGLGMIPWRKIFSPVGARSDFMTQDSGINKSLVSRRVLWTGFWLIVPVWVIYTQSVNRPVLPMDTVTGLLVHESTAVAWPRLDLNQPKSGADFYPDFEGLRVFFWSFSSAFHQWIGQLGGESLIISRVIILGIVLMLIGIVVVWRRAILLRGTLRLLWTVVILLVVCTVIGLLPRFADKSVWMPRYVGVILPAFFIVLAVLIQRLPGVWLKGVLIGFFVLINLSQYVARVFTVSEPPTDRLANDILISDRPSDTTVRTYVGVRHRGPEPGMGTFPSSPASYYLWLKTRMPDTRAVQIRNGTYHRGRIRVFEQINPSTIRYNLQQSPHIQRVIVWTSDDWDAVDTTDPLARALVGQFRRVSDEKIPVYDHWKWVHLYNLRRREYVRIG